MPEKTYKAMIVEESAADVFTRRIAERRIDDLPPGSLLVRVHYSSLNYKDALSATGNKGVTRNYPHTPGIDAAGEVVECADVRFSPGDRVLVTGFDLGMNTAGGFGQFIRVPSEWAIKIPAGLSVRESMILGTAGLTAGLCVLKLEESGVRPDSGRILVTGATGGVGSLAVSILAQSRYPVTAVTGKSDAAPFLANLGATEVIGREAVLEGAERPLMKERWAGVVDVVGGEMLAAAVKSTRHGGAVACCGLVGSPELPLTVFPFILRGVSLQGVDSAQCPRETRLKVWERLAGPWKPARLDQGATECTLEELEERIQGMLKGELKGRTVVDLGG